ncbi:MAG: tetratricopeptide repeat protein [Ignavibacteria bacterium]|jgi:tetratricopeptide (TPR) repeat protein
MRKIIFAALFSLILFPNVNAQAEAENLLQQGNTYYQSGQFAEAIEVYEKILSMGYESSALHYNLGNAYFRSEQLGLSILNYEKALKLDPDDEDIQYNLSIARTRTIDKIKEVPQLFIVEWWNSLLAVLSINSWAVILLVFYLLLLLCIGLYYISRSVSLQRKAFYFGFVNLILLVIVIILFTAKVNREATSDYAILLEPATTAKQSPSEESSDVFEIHEGVKIKVEEKFNEWSKIRLADGKIGWLPNSSFQEI